jgi:hypothetical protein
MTKLIIPGIFCLLLISCKKETPATCSDGIKNQDEIYTDCGGSCAACPLVYPTTGPIGQNLLYGDDDTLTLISSNYSFKSTMAQGSSLEIETITISGDPLLYGLNEGWNISNAQNGLHIVQASHGTAELIVNLSNSSGTTLLSIKENGDVVTREKVIVWE